MADRPPQDGADRERRGIQSIDVGVSLLFTLARHGRSMALGDLSRAADMPNGKAHPYLVSFGKVGLVVQDGVTGHYWLGPAAIQLGLVSLRRLDPVREAMAEAETLAETSGHSVALSVWGNQGPTIVRQIDPIYPLHTNLRTGTVMSLTGTATGRLFAAYLPRQLIEDAMDDDRRRLGPDIDRPVPMEHVERELSAIRRHGLSRSQGKPTPGVTAIAAPVFDYSGQIVLGITLMGATGIVEAAWTGAQATAVKGCARNVSRRLGYHEE